MGLVGIDSNMEAELLFRKREGLSETAFVEMVIWRVPDPVRGSGHGFRYRLALVADGVSSSEETQRQTAAAFRGEKVGEFTSFATVELLWKVLTAKRWDILQAMSGQGEMTIREIARRVDRDVKAVHGDVQALVVVGVLDRADSGRVIFP